MSANLHVPNGVMMLDHQTGLTFVREGDEWVCRTTQFIPEKACASCDHVGSWHTFHPGSDNCRTCEDDLWCCEGCEEEFYGNDSEHEDRDGGKWCDGCFQEQMTCDGCGDDCGASGGIDRDNLFLPKDADGINKTSRPKCEDCLTPAGKERLKALRGKDAAPKPIITAGDAYDALVAMG